MMLQQKTMDLSRLCYVAGYENDGGFSPVAASTSAYEIAMIIVGHQVVKSNIANHSVVLWREGGEDFRAPDKPGLAAKIMREREAVYREEMKEGVE